MAGVDDCAIGAALRIVAAADEELGDRADRFLRRRQADADQLAPGELFEALERQREVRAALVRRERVDFVDDHGSCRCQHLAPALAREQDVERFGRRDDDVRKAPTHLLALGLRRVSRANGAANPRARQAEALQLGANAGERYFEVALDVVRECFQRRDVDDARFIGQATRPEAFANERIDRREKRRERLARTRGRGDEHMAPGVDRRPGVDLRRRRRGEGRLEPAARTAGWKSSRTEGAMGRRYYDRHRMEERTGRQ